MNRKQLHELKHWHPPKKWHTKGYGEYTKTEALYILTTAIKYSWGRKFDSRVMDYEQELIDISCTLDGITDDSVYMRNSMTPQIITSLTSWDYDKWFRSLNQENQALLPSELVVKFLQGMTHLHNQDFTVIDDHVHFEIRDISGKPLAYTMRLPVWMLGKYYSDSFYLEILHNLTTYGTIFPTE